MLSRESLAVCGRLLAVTSALWAVLLLPAWFFAGWFGVRGVTVAALLCVIPGCPVMVVSRADVLKQQPMLILLASGLRLAFVAAGAFALQRFAEGFGFREFVIWLVAFYLATLAMETSQLVKSSG